MEHLIFFFYIISFSTGIASVYLSFFLFLQHRKKPLLFFFIFLFAMSLIMFAFLIHEYENIVKIGLDYAANMTNLTGGWIILCIFPFFSHTVIGLDISAFKKKLFILFSIVITVSILSLLYCLDRNRKLAENIETFILDPALILNIMYFIFLSISEYNSIGDKTLKSGLRIFFITTTIYLPLHIVGEYNHLLNETSILTFIETISFPLYFLAINMFSMIFAIKYYNQPAFVENNRLSLHFVEKYNITERETDIIHHLIEGLNNTEISRKLFVSIKTVENHLSNIYQKTSVKNRVQLVNLVLSNQ